MTPSKKLQDVTESELKSLCESHADQLNGLADPCLGEGLQESTQAECDAAVKMCEKDVAGQTDSIDCASADTKDVANCAVTVGEFEDCLQDIGTFIHGLTCAQVGKTLTAPACFDSLTKKCPSLFGGSTT